MGLFYSSTFLLFYLLSFCAPVAAQETGWLRVTGAPELRFPRDHGAHPEYRTEWWYLTGIVKDDGGERHGFQVTFFRQGLDPSPTSERESALRARQAVAGHLAVVDIGGGVFRHAERLRRVAVGLAGFSTRTLDVWVEDWQLRMDGTGALRAKASDRGAEIGVDLELRHARPPVAHGNGGHSRKGPGDGNASVYLSWIRLKVVGEVTVGGVGRAVEGEAWLDHEWGTSQLGDRVVGWDWFGLRLGDGRSLMVYRLRHQGGEADPHSSGTLVAVDGSVRPLSVDEVRIDPTGSWTSPATGAAYPSGWRIGVAGSDLDLEVHPLVAGCEVDGRASTGVVYWEGPVTVFGSHTGEGYAELTGYADSLAGRF
jgi:predicted secreted hydrolase